jgi:hypothetical protein
MAKRELVERIDESLIRRLSDLSPGAQRWLKTAVQTMRTMPVGSEQIAYDDETPPQHLRRNVAATKLPKRMQPVEPIEKLETPAPPTLEDVITGKRKLEEAEQYPELSEELEGLGEIIDMLRGLGESRRKRGEQILREEILGGGSGIAEDDDVPDDEDDFRF